MDAIDNNIDDISGLDDDSSQDNNDDINSNEICRLSWFLVQQAIENNDGDPLERQVKKPQYYIVHSMDVMDSDVNEMYINREVRFCLNRDQMVGKVLLASDQQKCVEKELRTLLKKVTNAALAVGNYLHKFLLVQYRKTADHIMHAVVNEKDTIRPEGAEPDEVLVADEKNNSKRYLAIVLFDDDSEEKLLDELLKLKSKCFEAIRLNYMSEDSDNGRPEFTMQGDPWLLVQYSGSFNTVVYAIIRYSQTIWHEQNLYKGIVVYLTDDESAFQAIIMHKTEHRHVLESALINLSESCLITQYPIIHDLQFHNFATRFANCHNKQSVGASQPLNQYVTEERASTSQAAKQQSRHLTMGI